jgi:glyoxylase-like metal-dependent hydrolase (beta-lactamase superfamily II)
MPRSLATELGDWQVVVLTDGDLEFGADVFPGTDPARIDSLLAAAAEPAIRTNFNAFLAKGRGRTVLVDAGPRDLFGPTAGHLAEALAETGTAPAAIDTIFVTHMHPDHIAGLVSAGGAATFPNAELVMAEAERAFWSDPARFSGDDTLAAWQALTGAVLGAYGERLRTIAMDGEIVPGLTALPLPGHTPGHCGVRLDSGDASFVHMGDIVHAQTLQLADPSIGVVFDVDPAAAQAARRGLLDMLASDGALCSGGHILQPALGRVTRRDGGFAFAAAD